MEQYALLILYVFILAAVMYFGRKGEQAKSAVNAQLDVIYHLVNSQKSALENKNISLEGKILLLEGETAKLRETVQAQQSSLAILLSPGGKD